MEQVSNYLDLVRRFSDEQKCREFLAQQRWGGSPECPYCGSHKWYTIENGKRFKCGSRECHRKYSVTVGTVFHDSNIPLSTWFPAIYLISAHKKGISSIQLAKDLGVTQKTAWFMLHRIRESLINKGSSLLMNTVEIDEVYIGSRQKNMHGKKKRAMREANGSGPASGKTMVIGMVERGGELRLQVAGADSNKSAIGPIIHKHIDPSASIMTDGEGAYASICRNFASHQTVSHSTGEYVRNGTIHTNTIEGAFGLLRRCQIGIYHRMSPKHLSRYCDEVAYRYNSREMHDGERFGATLGRTEGTLSWKDLTKDNGLTARATIAPHLPTVKMEGRGRGRKSPVCQILNGELIAAFPSIKDAADATGIPKANIAKVARGERLSTGGYEWKYM